MDDGGINNVVSIPNPVQGYYYFTNSKNEQNLIQMCEKTDKFVSAAGMEIKHRKCAILHGQRTGNNWSKRDVTTELNITVQDSTNS